MYMSVCTQVIWLLKRNLNQIISTYTFLYYARQVCSIWTTAGWCYIPFILYIYFFLKKRLYELYKIIVCIEEGSYEQTYLVPVIWYYVLWCVYIYIYKCVCVLCGIVYTTTVLSQLVWYDTHSFINIFPFQKEI